MVRDGRVLYSAVTGCGSDRNADIATLSDFSDDSEEDRSEAAVGLPNTCYSSTDIGN